MDVFMSITFSSLLQYYMDHVFMYVVYFCLNLTKEHSSPGATGLLHGQPGVLQSPVDTLEKLLLLRVHLLHLAVTDTEQLVVKLIEPGETEKIPKAKQGQSQINNGYDGMYIVYLPFGGSFFLSKTSLARKGLKPLTMSVCCSTGMGDCTGGCIADPWIAVLSVKLLGWAILIKMPN